MKKLIAIILSAVVLMSALSACKPGGGESSEATSSTARPEAVEQEPLRVFIDVDVDSNIISPTLRESLNKYEETTLKNGRKLHNSFETVIKNLGGPELELEFPPNDASKREPYISNLRTEILAGKGPDVFVCAAGWSYRSDPDDPAGDGDMYPMFNFPQSAMKRNIFLSLDQYIPDFQFTKWDSLTPVVMDAGKYKEAQYLLPMTYTVPMTIFKKSDFEHTPSKDMTWDDMLQSGPELKAAASLMSTSIDRLSSALMPLSAPDKEELSFTEEELMDFMTRRFEAGQESLSNDSLPSFYDDLLSVSFNDESVLPEGFTDDDELTLVPLYSRSGGVSAAVTSFAAVNANTQYPKAAAFLVDYLLGEECQRSTLYAYPTLRRSLPVMEGLMQKDTPLSGEWSLSPENYDALCALRSAISRTEFATPLDLELSRLPYSIRDPKNQKSPETLIHDAYMRMNMMLAES